MLISFSQQIGEPGAAGDRVYDLLMGNNPFLTPPLLTDGKDNFALTSGEIGLDALRRILERALPHNSADVRRYDQKARQPVTENLAKKYLEQLVSATGTRFNYYYHYLAAKKANPSSA